eukprot:5984703-Pleurochrysis_carterae.AAC.1
MHAGTARPPPDLDRLLLTANSCKKLHLCDAWVLDEHVSTLAHKLRAPDYACITSCYLDRNMLGDGGLGDLSRCIKAGGLPRCAYFSMSQNRIGDEGLRQLAQAIEANKMAEIVYLNLSSNRFGNAGASAFANAITFGGLPKLKTLSLDTNLIADKGMRDLSAALATATAAPALRCFEVASNRMGGAGLEALMMMVVARQGLQVAHAETSQMRTVARGSTPKRACRMSTPAHLYSSQACAHARQHMRTLAHARQARAHACEQAVPSPPLPARLPPFA